MGARPSRTCSPEERPHAQMHLRQNRQPHHRAAPSCASAATSPPHPILICGRIGNRKRQHPRRHIHRTPTRYRRKSQIPAESATGTATCGKSGNHLRHHVSGLQPVPPVRRQFTAATSNTPFRQKRQPPHWNEPQAFSPRIYTLLSLYLPSLCLAVRPPSPRRERGWG